MKILGPLTSSKQGIQFVFVMNSRYTKLSKAIPTSEENSTTVSGNFPEHWVANHGIASKLLNDHGSQFVSRLVVAVFSALGVSNITTIVDEPQTNGQAEHLEFTVVSQLGQYVSKQQTDWDTYLFL